MSRGAAAVAGLAAALALAAAGCGRAAPARHTTTTATVSRVTRVEVVRAAGSAGSRFDPQGIYRRDSPGVVTIVSSGFGGSADAGLGSGFVVSADGEIATNAHVVTTGTGTRIRKARQVFVRFGDGNQVPAAIVGYDPFSDVALIKVEPGGLTLRPLALGAIGDVTVGEPVAAIGSPFGEERSLSIGVISATDRSIESLTGFLTSGALQTDAAINSGNSGGPLLDARGRVLGINSQIRTTSGEGSGVGFAVPVDVVARSLDQLRHGGRAHYAYLGISTRDVYPQLNQRFGLGADHGAAVQQVAPGGPADRAGLRPGDRQVSFQQERWRIGGDVITRIGDADVRSDSDVSRALLHLDPGNSVMVQVVRGGARRTVSVRLGERPLQSPHG